MILKDYLSSWLARIISMLLTITTQTLFMTMAFADTLYQQQLAEATQGVDDIYSNFPYTSVNTTGDIVLDGEVIFSAEDATGQKDNTYLATDTSNAYGSDANTIIAGETVQGIYDNKDPETDSEMAYDLLKKTFSTQRPDLSNDPIWDQTDNVFENLSEIAKDFTECRIDKEVISDGVTYHIPSYERCEKLPIQSKSVTVAHSYEAGVIKHESGPFNIASCGDGCINVWIGTIGNNYWTGSCTIYEEEVVLEIIQPNAITFAELKYSYFDDYHQVLINGELVYNGPNGEFPPEIGTKCDLERTWAKSPQIDVTSRLKEVESGSTVDFKTRTSVGEKAKGIVYLK
ncbi:hypothetical protein [Psychromonas sp. KJ10-2]|uniref:hypothetical protein n=1 Tax=Psychromonas sp. KJ10-2 TaxID=3391822 RepID=UPI0039B38D0B